MSAPMRPDARDREENPGMLEASNFPLCPADGFADFEVMGYDGDGASIVQWDGTGDTCGYPCPYVCGETPEEYGLHNLEPIEMARLLLCGWIPADE